MSDTALKALEGLRFRYTPNLNDVWHRPVFHVDSLHRHVVQTVLDGLAEAPRLAWWFEASRDPVRRICSAGSGRRSRNRTGTSSW